MHVSEQSRKERGGYTYVFLLFMHVPDLEPYVFFRQRARRVGDDVFEALYSQCMKEFNRTADLPRDCCCICLAACK